MKNIFNRSSRLAGQIFSCGRLLVAEAVDCVGAVARLAGVGNRETMDGFSLRCGQAGESLNRLAGKIRGAGLPSAAALLHGGVTAVDRVLQPDMVQRINDFVIGGPRRAVRQPG